MSKDPAFLFYPGDWLGGTMYLTHQEKGAYMDLLMLQFNQGGRFTLAQAKQVLSICFDLVWATLQHKFKTDGKMYWNEKLLNEMTLRKNFTESRRLNALGVKKGKKQPKPYAKHMEDEDVNENEWIRWGKQIVDGTDIYWDQMKGRKIATEEMAEFISVATRNNWKITEQHKFRVTLNGWTSYKKSVINGKNPGKF